MKKLSLMVLLFAAFASTPVIAADHYTVYAHSLPTFNYAEAVAERPLRVTTATDDGKCQFSLSMVGYQQGSIPNNSLTGRIEQGECNGKPVRKGLALGTVTFSDGKAVLDRFMQVVIFE